VFCIVSVGVSILVTALFDVFAFGALLTHDLLIAGAIPTIILPMPVSFLIAMSQDLRRREKNFQITASRDDLTGLLNRRALLERTEHIFNLALRHGRPLSLCMVDFDHFKDINDSKGHAAGDAVLKHFARLAMEHLMNVDLVGRYGGEEFIIVMPETSAPAATRTLQRLRVILAANPAFDEGKPLPVTISAGLVALDGSTTHLCEFIKQADRMLYAAKRAGRDRITTNLPVCI